MEKATQTRLHCYQVEVIAAKMLGHHQNVLRNIHIANINGSFICYADGSFLYQCQYFCWTCLNI